MGSTKKKNDVWIKKLLTVLKRVFKIPNIKEIDLAARLTVPRGKTKGR